MKTNSQIVTESKLLEKMDERERLEETLDWVLFLMDDLAGVIISLEDRDPNVVEKLFKVYRPLDRKAEEVSGCMHQLEEQIDRLYADLLVQEAEANEPISPAMHVMLPPYLEQTLFEKRSALYRMS